MAGEPITSPKTPALAALYWRSEILQVMYWLRGEGFGDIVDAGLVERFLGVDATIGVTYLDRLVDEGYLVADGPFYSLSDLGRAEGAAEFASSFADLMRPTHGECDADCWCHQSADEAEACSAARRSHEHDVESEHHVESKHEHDHDHASFDADSKEFPEEPPKGSS